MKKLLEILLITGFILVINSVNTYSQTPNDVRQILDLMSKRTGLILYQKPSGYISKNKIYLNDIYEFLKDNGLDSIPSNIILEMADRFDNPDYTNWTYTDFPNKVIINKKDTVITYKTELKRIGLIDKSDKKRLRKQISNFNYYKIKEINYISRPIFHESGEYAVVQHDNCVNLTGGGGVSLFKKVNRKWIEYGSIYWWAC
jgi:hypothetical protein